MSKNAAAASLFTFVAGFSLFICLALIVLYVLMAMGLYTMAKNRGLDYPWFAWIPFLNLYLLGELTGNEMWGMEGSKWVLLFGPFVLGLISLIPILGGILYAIGAIALMVYELMVLYRLYQMYTPNNAVLFIILSILFSLIATPIIVFTARNNQPTRIPYD